MMSCSASAGLNNAARVTGCSVMDELDKKIINRLQKGLPISDTPYAEVAAELACDEQTLLDRLQRLLATKQLTRFGPMYHAERMGGAFSLVAMKVAAADFERVTEQVNAFTEVAHNYQREHEFNMWFVLATESVQRIAEVNAEIEQLTGYPVYNMPKLEEFYIGLDLEIR